MITTKLLPYSETPHQTLLPLQNWLQGFEFKSKSLMRVAVASNDKGPIASACYIRVDDSYLISTMIINPKASAEETKEACNGIDGIMREQAQLEGVTKLYLVTPGTNECKLIDTFAPKVTQVKELQAPSHAAYNIN
jgi:hypothetical protein